MDSRSNLFMPLSYLTFLLPSSLTPEQCSWKPRSLALWHLSISCIGMSDRMDSQALWAVSESDAHLHVFFQSMSRPQHSVTSVVALAAGPWSCSLPVCHDQLSAYAAVAAVWTLDAQSSAIDSITKTEWASPSGNPHVGFTGPNLCPLISQYLCIRWMLL